MHTAVVASIGTTLPEQPCPAISCAKHAKAAAVTATPSTPKSRNERKNQDGLLFSVCSEIQTEPSRRLALELVIMCE